MRTRNSNSPLAAEFRANWPALSFYYGLSFEELRRMPRFAREEYARQLPELLASRQLRAIEAATFPWADEKTRDKIMDGLMRHVDRSPASEETPRPSAPEARGDQMTGVPKPKSIDEMAMLATASGFGFVKEPGKHSDANYEGQLRKLAREKREQKRLADNEEVTPRA